MKTLRIERSLIDLAMLTGQTITHCRDKQRGHGSHHGEGWGNKGGGVGGGKQRGRAAGQGGRGRTTEEGENGEEG